MLVLLFAFVPLPLRGGRPKDIPHTMPTNEYRVLVTGATGVVGSLLLSQLESVAKSGALIEGKPIVTVGTTRSEAKRAEMARKGSQAVILDLDDFYSFHNLLSGFDAGAFDSTFFLATSYTSSMCEQGKYFADACAAVGVRHLVHLGVRVPPKEAKVYFPLIAWHELVETYIRAVLPNGYTFLHPAEFMDNCLSYNGRPRIRNGVISWYALPDTPTLWIAGKDIAASAAAVLLNPSSHRGQTYQLGTQIATMNEACQIFSAAVGREIRHEMMDGNQLYAETEEEDPTDVGRLGYIKFIAREAERRRTMYQERVKGSVPPPEVPGLKILPDVELLTGRKPTGLKEFAEENKEAFLT
ncbi:hypothetical protein HDU93_009161 [Gonapodya sp. JEL0774]|nr:hypothetical protein HDU93_009161 [Gonapodya sp. JEL0774]